MVRAVVPVGTEVSTYVGRVAVRTTGWFNVATSRRTIQGIAARYCQTLQHQDGYSYAKGAGDFLLVPLKGKGVRRLIL
jgi:hypothetical protein